MSFCLSGFLSVWIFLLSFVTRFAWDIGQSVVSFEFLLYIELVQLVFEIRARDAISADYTMVLSNDTQGHG